MKKRRITTLLTAGALLLALAACRKEEPAAPVNPAPVALAGRDQMVILPANSTELKGGGIDADGTIVSYRWTKVSGPAAFTLSHPDAAVTRVDGLEEGRYIFRLSITDDDGLSATDEVIVDVVEKSPWDY